MLGVLHTESRVARNLEIKVVRRDPVTSFGYHAIFRSPNHRSEISNYEVGLALLSRHFAVRASDFFSDCCVVDSLLRDVSRVPTPHL